MAVINDYLVCSTMKDRFPVDDCVLLDSENASNIKNKTFKIDQKENKTLKNKTKIIADNASSTKLSRFEQNKTSKGGLPIMNSNSKCNKSSKMRKPVMQDISHLCNFKHVKQPRLKLPKVKILKDFNVDQSKKNKIDVRGHVTGNKSRAFQQTQPSNKMSIVEKIDETKVPSNRKERKNTHISRFTTDPSGKQNKVILDPFVVQPYRKESVITPSSVEEEEDYVETYEVIYAPGGRVHVNLNSISYYNEKMNNFNKNNNELASTSESCSECKCCVALKERVDNLEKQISELRSLQMRSIVKKDMIKTISTPKVNIVQHVDKEVTEKPVTVVKEIVPEAGTSKVTKEVVTVVKESTPEKGVIKKVKQEKKVFPVREVKEKSLKVFTDDLVKEIKINNLDSRATKVAKATQIVLDSLDVVKCQKLKEQRELVEKTPKVDKSVSFSQITRKDLKVPDTVITIMPIVKKSKGIKVLDVPKGIQPRVWKRRLDEFPESLEGFKEKRVKAAQQIYASIFFKKHTEYVALWRQVHKDIKGTDTNPYLQYGHRMWKNILTKYPNSLWDAIMSWDDKVKTFMDPKAKLDWSKHKLISVK